MVVYRDGSVMAQLALPDMRIPIAYALSYPERLDLGLSSPDLFKLGALTFREPDLEKFACLALAIQACRMGKTYPAVLSAANEVAVGAFLDHRIGFGHIAETIKETLAKHEPVPKPGLSDILSADTWARRTAEEVL
jgi:1-deoxy-D-xylulose-5-phosphate reductoisomerase